MKNLKNILLIFLGLIVVFNCSIKQRVITLKEVSSPQALYICEDALYLTNGTEPENKASTILMYSITEFRLLAQFGGDGDEPGKFRIDEGHTVWMGFPSNKVFVNDLHKISFFSRNGDFINEVEVEKGSAIYHDLGDKFIGQGYIEKDEVAYYTINLYNEGLKKLKEVYRIENQYQSTTKKNRVFTLDLGFETYKNRIYIKGKDPDFVIDVFDNNGEKIKTVKLPCQREKVSEVHKESIYDGYRNHPLFGKYFDQIKKEIVFPEYLPAIKDIRISDDRIYALTYTRDKGKNLFYIIDLDGNLIAKKMIPFEWISIMVGNPYDIHKGKLYQMIKSEISGDWELHIYDFGI